MKKIIKLSPARQASLVGIMIWSAHFHTGQTSREYRMGCRARTLLGQSNEIGDFMASRWFDSLESFVDNRSDAPRTITLAFSNRAKATYQKLANLSEKTFKY